MNRNQTKIVIWLSAILNHKVALIWDARCANHLPMLVLNATKLKKLLPTKE